MEYKKDLLQNNEKSIFRLVLGLMMCLLSIVWIVLRWTDDGWIRVFDWAYSGIFALNGVTHCMTGLGTSIERFFGKSYIHIDTEVIVIKLGAFEKEQKIFWKEIQSIKCSYNDFYIIKENGECLVFSISSLNKSTIIDVKSCLSSIANSKNVAFIS